MQPSGPPTLTNDFVRAYTFDGLGRLVRTQRQALDDFGDPTILSTRFYYDGVRRIQEVVGDDVAPAEAFMAGGGGGGDPQLEALAETIAIETMEASSGTPLDTTTAPIALEQGQLNQAQALVGGGGGPPPDTGPSREYVWGPGDNGLDELLVQFDSARVALYILQDAGGDIVAAAQRSQFEFWTNVCSQYTFDAYGCVQTSEIFAPHAPLHAGHKGLFFDRLDDTAPFDPAAGEAPSLIPFTQHVYHVRNRSYCPQLGRWMQRDPNATALTLAEAGFHHGRGMMALAVAGFVPDDLYGDGYNLYEYLGSEPWARNDPLGLSLGLGELGGGTIRMMVASALLGGVLNSGAHAIANRSFKGFWWNFGVGAGAGAIGGVYYGAASAFAASLSGLVGTMAASAAPAIGAGAGGYAYSRFSGASDREATADAFFAINLTLALGNVGLLGRAAVGAIDDAGGVLRLLGYVPRGPYYQLADDGYTIAPGRDFARGQRKAIQTENRRRNNGVLRCDETGTPLVEQPGLPNSAEVDHIVPKSRGGDNSFANARLVSLHWNRVRGNR